MPVAEDIDDGPRHALYAKELGVGRGELICPGGLRHEEEQPMRGLNAFQMRRSNGKSDAPNFLSRSS